jgi:hypothetical protein
VVALQQPSFSRGLAEEHAIDRAGILARTSLQNRRGTAVVLEVIVGPLVWQEFRQLLDLQKR